MRRGATLLVLVAPFVASCGGDDDQSATTSPDTEVTIVTTQPPSSGKPAPPTSLPGSVPTTPRSTAPSTSGTTPDSSMPPTPITSVEAAIADLAARVGVEPSTITVVDHRDVTWADGSLGCPRPDMSYIQVLTPGALLVLATGNGTRFEYHAGSRLEWFYCATPRPPIEGQGGAD